ncbi:MAG: helix-turn-helix domain-containing protein [Pedobacter sp.]
MNSTGTTLGQRISAVRRAEKMSQQAFSTEFGISQTYLSLLETDRKVPSETLLGYIACRFRISKEWLFEGKGTWEESREENSASAKTLSRRDIFARNAIIAACILGPITPIISGTIAIGVGTAHILSKMCKAYQVTNAAGLAKKLEVDQSTIKYWVKNEKVPEKYLHKSFVETDLSPEDITQSNDLLFINKKIVGRNLRQFLEEKFGCTVDENKLIEVIERDRDIF